jgi:hypothetical protein
MNTILSLVAIISLNTGNLNEDDSLIKETKLISEIIENMEEPEFFENIIEKDKIISIYTPKGELLHEFSENNFDAIAIRNTDFLIEDASSKIFIKHRN